MDLSVLGAGLVLGLSIAAPVGPMGLLCINRTLRGGLAAGLAIGAGIATGDTIYGAVAAFGFSAVTDLLIAFALPLRLMGGLFLVWLGVQAWRAAGQTRAARDSGLSGREGTARAYVTAIGLTLANPTTILSFIAAFGALGLAADRGSGGAGLMVAGVFAGSALWWCILCGGVALARRAITPRAMLWIDRLSALVLIAFGGAAAGGLLS